MKLRGYTYAVFGTIDWIAIGKASKTMTAAERTWLTKNVRHYNPTGQQLLCRKYWIDSKCLRCGEPDKDSTHFITCCHTDAVELRGDLILELSHKLTRYRTNNFIQLSIVMTLVDDCNSRFVSNLPDYDNSIPRDLYEEI